MDWMKSSRCESHACVEVKRVGTEVWVRNSTDPEGSILRFTAVEWVTFIGGVQDGDFNFSLQI